MANTFVTLKEIARQALPKLIDNLVFPTLMHRDFFEDFHGYGDAIRVRKPVALEAADFDEASGVTYQDMVEDTVEVTLDHIATVDARATAIETATSIDDLNRVFVDPAAAALAEKINRDGLALYRDVFTRSAPPARRRAPFRHAAARRQLKPEPRANYGPRRRYGSEADANSRTLDALIPNREVQEHFGAARGRDRPRVRHRQLHVAERAPA